MIYFRERKYESSIDASFILKDGPNVGDYSKWMIGESVSVLFEINTEMAKDINEHVRFDSGVRIHVDGFNQPMTTVHVPCVVVKRNHACSWKKVGVLQDLGTSVVLEAENGYWEDVLKWIVVGDQPTWINVEYEAAQQDAREENSK